VRQLITESAILGTLGALIGLALAAVALDVLSTGASAIIPRMSEVNIDGRVLGFALFLGLACGTIAGTVPALTLPWSRLGELLKEGGRGGTAGGSRGKTRKLVVVAEFALAFSVLICAGLLIKSLVRLQTTDLGIDEAGVVTFRLALPDDPYNEHSAFDNFLSVLKQRLTALPGVTAVGFSTALPPDRLGLTNNYTVEGEEAGPGEPRSTVEWLLVTGSYFDALRIPLLRGRTFTPSDREGQPGVVVVNEAFVRKHFPQEDPLGKRLKSGSWSPEAPWLTVVGVVGDVIYAGAAGGFNPTVYTAYRQNLAWHAPFVVMRARGDPESLVSQVRREVRALEPRTPLRDVATMEQLVRGSTAVERFRGTLFVLLAFVALVMAATGIYGVISYHVASRRRETAIRQALGARNVQVLGAVLRQALLLAALGVVVGSAGALLLTRALTAFLFEVSPTDATAFAGAALVLIAVAIVACLVPSVRASRVDPVTVLREE
jgi:predicted permease